MFKKKGEKKWKKVFYSRLTLIVLIFLLIFLGKASWDMYVKERETDEVREKSRQELMRLEQRAEALQSKVEKLSTERGREEIIRENFDVAREGEGVIVIVDDEQKNETQKTVEKNWWGKLIGIFKYFEL